MVENFHLNGFLVAGMTVSPIRGGDGNLEFLAWVKRSGPESLPDLECLVKQAQLQK
jgi:hypothetical protein